MTIKKHKINILSDLHYSKLLTFIAIGVDTYQDIRKIKQNLEGDYVKVPVTTLNIQVMKLQEGVIIYDEQKEPIKLIQTDGIKRRFNKKKWKIIEGALGVLFFEYLKQRYLIYKKNKEHLSEPSFKTYLKEKNFETEFNTIMDDIDKKYQVSDDFKKKHSEQYLLNNYSTRLKLFIEDLIISYLKKKFEVDRYNLMSRTLKYHFDMLVNILFRAYEMNLFRVTHSFIIFDMGDEKQSELILFFKLLEKICLGYENDAINFHYRIGQYVGYHPNGIKKKKKRIER